MWSVVVVSAFALLPSSSLVRQSPARVAVRMAGFGGSNDNPKQMSNTELITYFGLTDEWQGLTKAQMTCQE